MSIEDDFCYKAIQEIDFEDIKCFLCEHSYTRPVRVRECQHVFCKKCLDQKNCPICQVEIRKKVREAGDVRDKVKRFTEQAIRGDTEY